MVGAVCTQPAGACSRTKVGPRREAGEAVGAGGTYGGRRIAGIQGAVFLQIHVDSPALPPRHANLARVVFAVVVRVVPHRAVDFGRLGQDIDKVVFHLAVWRRADGSQAGSRAHAESHPGGTNVGRGRHLDGLAEIVDAGFQAGQGQAGARSAEQLLAGLEVVVIVEIDPPVQVDRAGQRAGNRDSDRNGGRLTLREGDLAEAYPVIRAQVRLGTK